MSFHARSVADLGRLFVDLSDRLARGGVPAALEMMRTTFSAEGALLSVDCRNRSRPSLRDLAVAEGSDLFCEGLISSTGAMKAQRGYHQMTTSWLDEDTPVRYSLRLFRKDILADFDADETILAEQLLLQLGRSNEFTSRRRNVDVERALYSDILERLQIGIIVMDQAGRLLTVSPRAKELLDGRDGLQLVNGRLCALNSAEDKRFQELIRAALADTLGDNGNGKGLSLTKRASVRKMGVIVRRVPASEGSRGAVVSISIRDAETPPDLEAGMMREIFDLTPAEAAVAGHLTVGLSLEDTACALEISHNTVRAHLRSIFSKSGIKRQTDLVRLVLNSAVVL